MQVYLAGSYRDKDKITRYAEELKALGIVVQARWLQEIHPPNTQIAEVPKEELIKYAVWDLEDIESSDAFIQICDEPNVRGGAHNEFGFALAKGKYIFVVGKEHTIFHLLPKIFNAPDWETAKNELVMLDKILNGAF